MRPAYAPYRPPEDDDLEKALNAVPDGIRQADFVSEDDILSAGGGAPSVAGGEPVVGSMGSGPVAPAPASPQGPSRQEFLRKVLEQQQAHDTERASALSAAARKDRKRQSESNVREYLRAAFGGGQPQLRNVGDSFSKEAAAEGNQGPLSRELALQNLLARYEKKPEDALGTQLKQYQVLKLKKELEAPPKDTSGDFLDESEIAGTEKQMTMAAGMPVKLPRDAQGRVRRSFVGPFNSSSSGMGMMESKEGVAAKSRAQARKFHEDAAARKAADELAMAEGAKVEIGGEVWSPPANSKNPEAVKDIQQRARATRVVLAGLDELDRLFDEAAKKTTSPARRAAIESRIGILAPQMNVAVGQGAMSQDEFARVKQSTGDVSSTDYWLGGLKASMDGGQNVMKARIGAAKRAFRSSFEETARASRWTPAASPESIQTDSEGKKWRELPDGSFEEVP